MKKILPLFLLTTFFFTSQLFSQELKSYISQKDKIENKLKTYGELYFKFNINSREKLAELGRHISVDNVIDKIFYCEVYAYASAEEMAYFAEQNIDFALLKNPGDVDNVKMSDNIKEIMAWDSYPTYSAYITMMSNFAANYPNLCRIVNIGPTVSGRQVLYAVISDSVNSRKPKPRFLYTSSMHGDETAGYVLMLRLIDTLLSGYGNNAQITNLVKNVEIWINPLANPDGTYHGGDNTVTGAWRYNANGKDLNRNFPDPLAGQHPDGNAWQQETINCMNMMAQNNFTLSMNFHGGSQVFNYPWDHKAPLHPDDAYFIHIGRHWLDTVHAVNSSYMVDNLGYPNIPGLVNGYAWYIVTGGRQDYMTYFNGGREVTLEISSTKLLSAANLPAWWNYNHKSFLNYIKETLYGIRGTVKDSITGLPVKAKIYVSGVADTNWVYSDSICGDYHRLIAAGTYSLIFKAPNYYTKTVSNITAYYDSVVYQNVLLRPITTSAGNETEAVSDFMLYQNYPNPFNPTTNIIFDVKDNSPIMLSVFDICGKEITVIAKGNYKPGHYEIRWDASKNTSGIYFCRFSAGNYTETRKMIYIK
ncbi:MAG: T9SS type A sorting domain-containing protein [Bacteroidetes bacterium]|nr:T9SS type A sorting domain-containing protein [Bacteroidota bacterium]